MAICCLNRGDTEEIRAHCPRIKIAVPETPDRMRDSQQTNEALKTGVPLKLVQVYERIGFDAPEDGDEIVQQTESGGGGLFGGGGASSNVGVHVDEDEGAGGLPGTPTEGGSGASDPLAQQLEQARAANRALARRLRISRYRSTSR
jgi:hypothetical protein